MLLLQTTYTYTKPVKMGYQSKCDRYKLSPSVQPFDEANGFKLYQCNSLRRFADRRV